MSQNSLTLPTSGTLSGLGAVQAVNAALDTLNTLASGASAPSSPEAGQLWHDTGNSLLKIRSQDNTTWIIVGSLDETNHIFSAQTKAAPPIYGLTISNDSTTPATFIDVAAGGSYDSTAAFYMRLSAVRKNVSIPWTSGTGNGSLDTGTFQASKFYHVFLIYDATSGASEILTSLSYGNPTLPSGYGYFVAIGAFYSDSSGHIWSFSQDGNLFTPVTGFYEFTGNPPITVTALNLHVPTGCKVKAILRLILNNGNGGSIIANALVYNPEEGSQTPSNPPSGDGNASISAYANALNANEVEVLTSTSGQVNLIASQSTNVDLTGYLRAFEYPRGLQ